MNKIYAYHVFNKCKSKTLKDWDQEAGGNYTSFFGLTSINRHYIPRDILCPKLTGINPCSTD